MLGDCQSPVRKSGQKAPALTQLPIVEDVEESPNKGLKISDSDSTSAPRQTDEVENIRLPLEYTDGEIKSMLDVTPQVGAHLEA